MNLLLCLTIFTCLSPLVLPQHWSARCNLSKVDFRTMHTTNSEPVVRFGKRAFMTGECGMNRSIWDFGNTYTKIQLKQAWQQLLKSIHIAPQSQGLSSMQYLSG